MGKKQDFLDLHNGSFVGIPALDHLSLGAVFCQRFGRNNVTRFEIQ